MHEELLSQKELYALQTKCLTENCNPEFQGLDLLMFLWQRCVGFHLNLQGAVLQSL